MSRPELLDKLVDDAGLFPPTALEMSTALDRHRRDQRAGERMLTHRFLCPVSRIEEMRTELVSSDRVRVGLVADRGAEGMGDALDLLILDRRLSLALMEFPLGKFGAGGTASAMSAALRALGSVPMDVAAYIEPEAIEDIEIVVRELPAASGSGRRIGGKLRCGGERAELFPSPEQVARFVVTCVQAQVPFTATAGLHHAVRQVDPETGFRHHGSLNLVLAVALARAGASESEVESVLEVEGPDEIARRIHDLGHEDALATRSTLISYGSCSTSTPVHEVHEIFSGGQDREA